MPRRTAHVAAALLVVVSTLTPLVGLASAASTISQTFNYTGSTQTFTVPDGVSTLNVTLSGGQGGRGGGDSQGSPTPGGYRGVVTGTIEVTPGQVITVGVGGGGGTGVSSRGSAAGGSAGLNPLDGYDGAVGGTAGPAGSSGGGGGSGAATVVRVDGVDIVAAGAGGNGGNGQYLPIVGRRAEETHQPRADATSTTGRVGKNTSLACSPGFNCDGGASGAGGGGAQGGEQGDVQYGGDSATEYFGFGGYPGANSSAGLTGLSSFYEYYAGNSANGSVTISYDDGAPGAPRSVSGTPGPGQVVLDWLAPTSNGAAEITDYVVEYATSVDGTYSTFDDGVSTSRSTTVTGLTNGTTYWFRVAAVNSVGTGPSSSAMTQGVMASDVPGAPTISAIDPIDAGLQVDVVPGATHSPVTSWEYRVDGGEWQTGSITGNRLTAGGLINGTSYAVEVRARNAVGAGAASSPASGTPRAVPSAPTSLVASASDTSVALSWQAPASDNGAVVTDYVVQYATSASGPWTTAVDGVSTSTGANVTSLTNGTSYWFRVAAVNAAGTGASSASAGATPYSTPAAPVISSLGAADGSLVVDLGTSSDGGAVITRYEYRLDGAGAWVSTGSNAEPFTIGGLSNGTSYDVEVRAVNAAGTSPASAPAAGTPRSVPAAPSISAVALDTGAVAVSFSTGSDGGSPLTNVQYTLDSGDTWITRSPASTASPLTISGLVGGQTYGVRLRAVNAQGAGAASNESLVTAKGTPESPTITGVTPGDSTLSVAVSAGPNGGSAITNYEYSVDGGGSWTTRAPASTASPVVITGLENGTSYAVRVRAVNAAGSGAASASQSATPRTTPGAPVIGAETISGVGGELDVDFTAPTSDGGSSITTYQYSTDAGATWRTRTAGSTASPLRITTLSSDGTTPLVGGQTYPVELRAVNSAGPGAASAVADGITTTIPDAPTIDGVEVSDGTALVTFDIPANGGAAIIRYDYRLDGGTWTDTGSMAGEVLITGLSNAGTYTVEVRAVNNVGASPASAPRSVSVRTTPSAPEVTGVVAGDTSLTVSFAPGDDGGDSLTTYEYSTDGGVTWRTRSAGSTASPLVITTTSADGEPLVNGRLYVVQVRAVNSVGSGAASPSTLIAPQGTPDAPTDVALVPGDGSLAVSFVAGDDGGSAVIRVEYRLNGGTWVDSGSLASPFTINGLTNGTAYDVEVRAVSALGAGDGSDVATGTPSTPAGAPGSVSATVEDSATTGSWSVPASDGGAAIDGYVVTLYDQPSGGIAVASCSSTGATTCSVTGLTNGTTYYVGVVAQNAAGSGPASAPRVAVAPLGRPDVTISAITPAATELSVDVTTDDGGSPVSTYEYRLDGGSWTSASTASEPFTISGLTTGRSYVVEVRAVNSVGAGDASAPVAATPRTLPGAPTALAATNVDGSAQLSWSAPSSDGGDAITDYVVQYATTVSGPFTTFDDGVTPSTSAVVTGLTNGTTYVIRVAAVNSAGTGPVSSLASVTPLSAPSAPTLSSLAVGSQYIQATFTAPTSTGGTAITGYQYQLDGGEWRNASGTTSPLTIPGLTNGRTYSVAIRAVNAVGGGTSSASRTATPYGLPSAVSGFLASPTSNSVSLTWDAADDNGSAITAYSIIRWSARTEGSIAASYQTTSTSYSVTGLSAGTYYFTIEARNAAGTGQRSSPRTSATVGGTVPAAPVIAPVSVDGASAELSWTAGSAGSSAITGYVIQYDDGARSTLVESTTTGTSATVELPSVDDPYSLDVAMVSATGVGSFATVRPPLAGTGAVSGIGTHEATVAGTVNANDRTAMAVVEYATDVAQLGTPAASTATMSPDPSEDQVDTAVSVELSGLSAGTTYWARVSATSEDGTTVGSAVSFTTTATVSTTGRDVTYDGRPVELLTVTEPVGLGVEQTYVGTGDTVYASTSTPPTDAGTYTVTTTIVDDVLAGSEIAELVIRPRELGVVVTAADRAYDGTTDAALDVELTGAVDSDDVEVDPTRLSGRFAGPDAGADKEVTIEADFDVLSGADAANYTATFPATVTASITRATQLLAFETDGPTPLRVGSSYAPEVSSSAGLPVDLAVLGDPDEGDGAPCELVDGDVVGLAPGSCVVVASQDGNTNVEAADTVGQFLTVAAVATSPDPDPEPDPDAEPAPTGEPESSPASPTPSDRWLVGTTGEREGSASARRSDLAGTSGSGTDALDTTGPLGPPMSDGGSSSSSEGRSSGTPSLGQEVAASSTGQSGSTDGAASNPLMGLVSGGVDRPGVVAALLLLGAGLYFGLRRRGRREED